MINWPLVFKVCGVAAIIFTIILTTIDLRKKRSKLTFLVLFGLLLSLIAYVGTWIVDFQKIETLQGYLQLADFGEGKIVLFNGKIEKTIGKYKLNSPTEKTDIYKRMVELYKSKDYATLAALASEWKTEDAIWATPYHFSGVANFYLGNADQAKTDLRFFMKKAPPHDSYQKPLEFTRQLLLELQKQSQ